MIDRTRVEIDQRRERRALVVWVAVCWVTIAITLGLVQMVAKSSDVGANPDTSARVSGWIQFDGHEYLNIARVGYDELNDQGRTRAVWFPGYPLLIRAGSALATPQIAAVGWSAACGLIGVLGVGAWMFDAGLTRRQARLGCLALMVYPYAWFLYGGAYPNSLLLATSVGAFLAARRRNRSVAVVLCAVATLTHPLGLALIAGLLVGELERAGVLPRRPAPAVDSSDTSASWRALLHVEWRRIRLRDLYPLAGLAGILAYSGFLQVRTGNALEWLDGQSEYHGSTLRAVVKADFFGRWVNWSDPQRAATTLLQAAFVVGAFWVLPRIWRTFGAGPAVFVLATLAFPLLHTDDFNGSGRYLLQAFPVAAAFGIVLGERSRNFARSWFVVSSLLLVGLSFAFARSWYLT